MHQTSYNALENCFNIFLKTDDKKLNVLDVGSYDVNGTYKPIFKDHIYTGMDVSPGPNVDLVMESAYKFPIEDAVFDVVVSGQTFEHIEFFWLTFLEMVRVTKPGGYICIIAPSKGPEHKYPVDCWRFYPDGMRALGKFGNCETVHAQCNWGTSDAWGDCCGVFKKP